MFAGKFKNNITQIVSLIVCFTAIVSLVYTSLTYGQVRLESDTCMPYRFWNSMKMNNYNLFPKSWNFANGELYIFSRFPICIILLNLFTNPIYAIVTASVVTVLLVCMVIVWLSKTIFECDSWTVIITMFCLYICSDEARDMIIFQAGYNTTFISVGVLVALFIRIVNSTSIKKRDVVIYSAIFTLTMMGGTRFAAEFMLPGIATVIATLLYDKVFLKKSNFKFLVQSLLLLLVPSIFGFSIYKVLCATHNMVYGTNSNPTIRLNIDFIWGNIRETINNTLSIFGYSIYNRDVVNWTIVLVVIFIIVILPIAQLVDYKKMNKEEVLFFVFCFMHNAEMFSLIVFSGLVQERYLLSSVFLSIIVSGNYLYKLINRLHFGISVFILGFYIMFTAFLCRDLLKLTSSWQKKLELKTAIVNELVEKGVKKAYATYWMGYPFEVYSEGQITVGGVDFTQGTFVKQYSNNDNSVFEAKDGKSCIILSEDEVQKMIDNLGDNYIDRMVGEPSDVLEIDSLEYKELDDFSRMKIFIFDEDICENLSDGIRDGVLTPKEMDYNKMGSRTDDAIYLINGGIVHGPYASIAPGKYTVTISGTFLNNCTSEIVSASNPNVIKYVVDAQNSKEIRMTLTVENYVDDLQFYLINLGDETVEFYGVNIEEMIS